MEEAEGDGNLMGKQTVSTNLDPWELPPPSKVPRNMVEQPFHPGHKADVKGVSGQPADARCARYYLTVNRFGLLFQFGNIPALLREKTEGGGRDDVSHEPFAIGIFHNVPPVPHSAASAIYR